MELKDFIGKVVIHPKTQARFILQEITSPEIRMRATTPNAQGQRPCYVYKTINGDPISTGVLTFENPALTQPFKEAYTAYCRSQDAYWEEYGHWMRMD